MSDQRDEEMRGIERAEIFQRNLTSLYKEAGITEPTLEDYIAATNTLFLVMFGRVEDHANRIVDAIEKLKPVLKEFDQRIMDLEDKLGDLVVANALKDEDN